MATTKRDKAAEDLFMLQERLKGKSYEEIAVVCKVNRSTVMRRLRVIMRHIEESLMFDYEGKRLQILNAAEMLILKEIFDRRKLQKASLNNLAYAFSQIHNARRLEEGKSTANISLREMIDYADLIMTQIKEIEGSQVAEKRFGTADSNGSDGSAVEEVVGATEETDREGTGASEEAQE